MSSSVCHRHTSTTYKWNTCEEVFLYLHLVCCSGDPAAEEWSQWSVCSLTCGQGWQVRTRSCVSSPYGTLCSGALRETRMCNNTASCPGEPGIIGSGKSPQFRWHPVVPAVFSQQEWWWGFSLLLCAICVMPLALREARRRNLLWLWVIWSTPPGCLPPCCACWEMSLTFVTPSRGKISGLAVWMCVFSCHGQRYAACEYTENVKFTNMQP